MLPPKTEVLGRGPGVVVGISDLAVIATNDFLITHALGSCIAVAVYDRKTRTGGLLHCLLPDSSLDLARAHRAPATFVDTGVRLLAAKMAAKGVNFSRCVVRIAGGSAVISTTRLNVGKRNILAARRALWAASVPIASENVGGSQPRTVTLLLPDGEFRVRIPGQPEFSV